MYPDGLLMGERVAVVVILLYSALFVLALLPRTFCRIRLLSFGSVFLVGFFSFAVVVFVCLVREVPVGARVLTDLLFDGGVHYLGFRVFPVGLGILGLCLLLFSAVLVWPVSFLLTETVLYFLGFYYFRALFYILQIALILVWVQLQLLDQFF